MLQAVTAGSSLNLAGSVGCATGPSTANASGTAVDMGRLVAGFCDAKGDNARREGGVTVGVMTGPSKAASEIARRASAIRRHVVRMVGLRGEGYIAQGLDAADLLAALYFSELRLDPAKPQWSGRDRFILSTAHNSAAFYATLAERGFFPVADLAEYGRDGSALEINASERVPGVEGTFGSLAQGLSVGLGMALSAKRRGQEHRIFVMLGDGELQEGQTWEAAMAAASYGVDNLCVIVDRNDMQVDGTTDRVLRMEPVGDKWRAFGWFVQEIDGHDIHGIIAAFDQARAAKGRPSVLVATTHPGRGVSFLEGRPEHYLAFPPELAKAALRELGEES